MKKVLLTTALIAALGTAASAQGIAPVATAPTTNVVVGTQGLGANAGYIAAAVIVVGVGIALSSSDGTN